MKTIHYATMLIPALVGFCFNISNARAQEVWTHVATSCTLDEDSTALAEFTAARITFKANQTGTISARCNVTNPRDDGGDPVWTALEAAYTDPDGNGSAYSVKAILRRVSNTTGGIMDRGTFNSNAFDDRGPIVHQVALDSGLFDFYTYAYYVQIEIRRSNTNANPTVSLLRLLQPGPF